MGVRPWVTGLQPRKCPSQVVCSVLQLEIMILSGFDERLTMTHEKKCPHHSLTRDSAIGLAHAELLPISCSAESVISVYV